MLGRTQHSIFYDEFHDEVVIPQPFAGAILTFPGGANGETPPLRIIQGPKAGLALNDVMTVDPVHNEYFVPRGQGGGMIHVFDRMAVGDVAPIRIIGGPKAGLGGIPSVDYEHNFLIVEGRDGLSGCCERAGSTHAGRAGLRHDINTIAVCCHGLRRPGPRPWRSALAHLNLARAEPLMRGARAVSAQTSDARVR